MTTPVQRVTIHMKPQRHPLFASVVTSVAIGAMILLGGCGNHSIQTTQNNANQPGSSQTSGQGNSAGNSTSQSSSSATQNLNNLNNSINGSVNALGNDQNNANTSASQSQEGEQQP